MAHTWTITVHLVETEDIDPDRGITSAHAVLTTSSGTTLEGRGTARRNPDDVEVEAIGEELATARALRDLSDRLLQETSDDLAEIEQHPVHLRS
ncbi:DUF1876 domain-containing protein [Isoptericola haloaureus]|uniref:DUF1876 domain-containing protein n=1 Tax=Isoptericola haloaureus TaxID=1542902 RepID=A0ABU7ZBI2_9MICO